MNIELLRNFCNKLPAVTEDIKWGNDLCFLVAGKMFCVACLEPPFKVSFKVTDDEFNELSDQMELFLRPIWRATSGYRYRMKIVFQNRNGNIL